MILFLDLSSWLMSCKVTYRYYIGMLSFLNEDYAKVRVRSDVSSLHFR